MKYVVSSEVELLDYLLSNIPFSHKKIKSLLKYQNILVNQKVVTKYNHILRKDDIVEIKEYKNKKHSIDLEIIYEDKHIVVVNKKAGLLTISTSKEREKTLYHMVSEYVKSINKNNNIFIIHRLDKDTSGIVIFAKNEKIKKLYQNNWNNITKSRKYIAIVEGILEKKEDTLRSYLEENEKGYVYTSSKGKLAITKYKVIKENNKYSLLDIEIKTGRKNQIRVQLKEIGNPIVGDSKYGNKGKYMYLCANELEVIDPITNKIRKYKVDIPNNFNTLMNSSKSNQKESK